MRNPAAAGLLARVPARAHARVLALGLVVLGAALPGVAAAVDDDLLAHRLYTEERFAEAAELFTDPAWKGAALYRSGQWWRAADAFVRADDARSAHNLGNAYVKLGYHALALEAYRRAFATDPSLDAARRNAELMVKLLALEEDENESGGRTASEEETERVERDEDDADPDTGEGGDEDGESGESGPGENETGDEESGPSDAASPGDGGQARDERQESRDGDGAGAVGGAAGERAVASRASGEAEGGDETEAAEAAGLRGALESEQATEQWLNRIAHDPGRYLEKRIALESRRRRAAGQSAPEGGGVW